MPSARSMAVPPAATVATRRPGWVMLRYPITTAPDGATPMLQVEPSASGPSSITPGTRVAAAMWICALVEPVAPLSSVTVSPTVYVPSAAHACADDAAGPDASGVPSPNENAYLAMVPSLSVELLPSAVIDSPTSACRGNWRRATGGRF